MDRSLTEWLLALSEEYEKRGEKTELHQSIQEELLDALSLITQESLPQDIPATEDKDQNPELPQPSPSFPAPNEPPRKRSDEEILQALLELKKSGKLQRSFSQKAAHTFAAILRPKKP